jgi:hypothetical protein
MEIVYCPHCREPMPLGTAVCPNCNKQQKITQLQSERTPHNYNQSIQNAAGKIIEYRRTCRVCGKVWHSLVSREKQIMSSQTSDALLAAGGAMQSCGTCGTVGSGTQAQASRNLDANQSELQRLRSCPECSSANYAEQLNDHANQTR